MFFIELFTVMNIILLVLIARGAFRKNTSKKEQIQVLLPLQEENFIVNPETLEVKWKKLYKAFCMRSPPFNNLTCDTDTKTAK